MELRSSTGFIRCFNPVSINTCTTKDTSIMDESQLDTEAHDAALDSGLRQWLNCESRCFGDKGDVEDITEGVC